MVCMCGVEIGALGFFMDLTWHVGGHEWSMIQENEITHN